jgi:phosphoribosylaminoimidazole-succinocarboxamide synthase
MMIRALVETSMPGRPPDARGKVRDIYDLGDRLLIVATDRLSAFDWINPTGIPGKGKILTELTVWWMEQMTDIVPNHLISSRIEDFPPEFQAHPNLFQDRSMLVRKCSMFPVEFVIRGYLAGSGWKEYSKSGTVCGIRLPAGLQEGSRLPEPLYTPATKSSEGHDINIGPAEAGEIIGHEWNDQAAEVARRIYDRAHSVAAERGLILADTKFEFGVHNGALMLADEILTPDSSRYWPADGYAPGSNQPSFDKQYVRDYLESTGWDKQSLPPALPEEVVEKTRLKYLEALTRLTGKENV